MKNIRMTSDWMRVALLLSEISRFMASKTKKLASRTFIEDRHVFKAQANPNPNPTSPDNRGSTVYQLFKISISMGTSQDKIIHSRNQIVYSKCCIQNNS